MLRFNSIQATLALTCVVSFFPQAATAADEVPPLKLSWVKDYLTISGPQLPGGEIYVRYIEAYCRPGSTDRDWNDTVIGHETHVVSQSEDGTKLKLHCDLKDGVRVEHEISTSADEVAFEITATNPTKEASLAHWAQPCVQLQKFTGLSDVDYVSKGFLFLDGKLERMPTKEWAMQARYTPGQVWCPKWVDRNDVNPRPLSDQVPSLGLIGCYSSDETMVMGVAFEPYQELFQGILTCLHADFRIGGLEPGETKHIRGKIYLLKGDVDDLVTRYQADFPEQIEQASKD